MSLCLHFFAPLIADNLFDNPALFNPLSANSTKQSHALKQFVSNSWWVKNNRFYTETTTSLDLPKTAGVILLKNVQKEATEKYGVSVVSILSAQMNFWKLTVVNQNYTNLILVVIIFYIEAT